jgi:hypothetical protein
MIKRILNNNKRMLSENEDNASITEEIVHILEKTGVNCSFTAGALEYLNKDVANAIVNAVYFIDSDMTPLLYLLKANQFVFINPDTQGEGDKIETMATSKGYIFINPLFAQELYDIGMKETHGDVPHFYIVFVIVHELYHQICNHNEVFSEFSDEYKDRNRCNRAMDYQINLMIELFHNTLCELNVTNLTHGLIDKKYYGDDWRAIYKDLPPTPPEDNKKQQKPRKVDKKDDPKYSSDYIDGYSDYHEAAIKIIKKWVIEYPNDKKTAATKALEEIKAVFDNSTFSKVELPVFEMASAMNDGGYNGGGKDAISKICDELVNTINGTVVEIPIIDEPIDNNPFNNISPNPLKPDTKNVNQNKQENGKQENGEQKNGDASSIGVLKDILPQEELSKIIDSAKSVQGKVSQIQINKAIEKTQEELLKTPNIDKSLLVDIKGQFNDAKKDLSGGGVVDWRAFILNNVSKLKIKKTVSNVRERVKGSNIYTSRQKVKVYKDGIRHVTISIDNSGSVMANDNIKDYFLREILLLLTNFLIKEKADIEECIVDLVIFSEDIYPKNIYRGTVSEIAEKLENISYGNGGGTNYVPVINFINRMSNIQPNSKESFYTNKKGKTIRVYNSDVNIIFTDGDIRATAYGQKVQLDRNVKSNSVLWVLVDMEEDDRDLINYTIPPFGKYCCVPKRRLNSLLKKNNVNEAFSPEDLAKLTAKDKEATDKQKVSTDNESNIRYKNLIIKWLTAANVPSNKYKLTNDLNIDIYGGEDFVLTIDDDLLVEQLGDVLLPDYISFNEVHCDIHVKSNKISSLSLMPKKILDNKKITFVGIGKLQRSEVEAYAKTLRNNNSLFLIVIAGKK